MQYSPFISLLLVCVSLVLITGCAARRDIAPDSRGPNIGQTWVHEIKEIEASVNKLHEDIARLRQEQVKNEAIIGALRREHAETGVAISDLREHIQQVRVSIDILRKDYNAITARSGKRDDETKDFRERLEALSFKVNFIENFIGVGNKKAAPDPPDKVKTLVLVPKEIGPSPAVGKTEKAKPLTPAPAPKEKERSLTVNKAEKSRFPIKVPKEKEPAVGANKAEKERLFASAFEIFKAGHYEKARMSFHSFLKLFPNSEFSDDAQFWIAETFYFENIFESAILEYEKVIKNFPGGNKIASALLKQGLSFANIGERIRARAILQQVIKDFPNSTQARTARTKLSEVK